MSGEAAFSRSWPVGQLTVTLSCPRPKPGQVLSAVIEWSPRRPVRLQPAELAQYRAGRDAALRDLSSEFGLTVGVVET